MANYKHIPSKFLFDFGIQLIDARFHGVYPMICSDYRIHSVMIPPLTVDSERLPNGLNEKRNI